MTNNETTSQALALAVATGVPVILWGSPGTGKTSVVKALASSWQLPCEVVIASIHDPTDFSGLPIVTRGSVSLAPPAWARRLADLGSGILFLDELTTVPPAVQAALLRVVLERTVGDLAPFGSPRDRCREPSRGGRRWVGPRASPGEPFLPPGMERRRSVVFARAPRPLDGTHPTEAAGRLAARARDCSRPRCCVPRRATHLARRGAKNRQYNACLAESSLMGTRSRALGRGECLGGRARGSVNTDFRLRRRGRRARVSLLAGQPRPAGPRADSRRADCVRRSTARRTMRSPLCRPSRQRSAHGQPRLAGERAGRSLAGLLKRFPMWPRPGRGRSRAAVPTGSSHPSARWHSYPYFRVLDY